jgi:hypothetical protein
MQYTNKLAIAFLCSQKEYQDGDINHCLKYYFGLGASKKYQFDLFFIFDQGDPEDYQDLLTHESCKFINKIHVHSLNLSDQENLYVRTDHSYELYEEYGFPDLGLSSGPNNSFFQGFDFLFGNDHENFLVLESDTRPVKYCWFDHMYKYCSEEDFLIAGSHYEGIVELPEDCEWKDHLNGVAIYKNCDLSKELLSESLSKVKQMVKEGVHGYFINYDIGVFYTIESSEENINKYKSGYKDTKLISNMSLGIDSKLKESYICQKNRDLVILHQKNRFLS